MLLQNQQSMFIQGNVLLGGILYCMRIVAHVWHVGHRVLGLSCHRGVWFLCCCWRPAGGSDEGETRPPWSPHWGPPCFLASDPQYLREIHWGNPTLRFYITTYSWHFWRPVHNKDDNYNNTFFFFFFICLLNFHNNNRIYTQENHENIFHPSPPAPPHPTPPHPPEEKKNK